MRADSAFATDRRGVMAAEGQVTVIAEDWGGVHTLARRSS